MNNKINLLIITILTIFLLGFSFASIVCYPKDITSTSNTIDCLYTASSYGVFMPVLKTSSGLEATISYKSMNTEPNYKYTMKIVIDYANSKSGKQYALISQGSDIYKTEFSINKTEAIDNNYEVSYLEDYALINIYIQNSYTENKMAIINTTGSAGYNIMPAITTIALLKNKITIVPIRAYYVNPDSGIISITISTSDSTQTISVPIYKQNAQVSESYKSTPLFLLANTKAAIIIDIVLFIVAVVLFTMFISRLGKKIIKK